MQMEANSSHDIFNSFSYIALLLSPAKCSGPTDVCAGANILAQGEDPPIKPDSEYPEWLFGLLDKSVRDAGKDDPMQKAYWKSRRKAAIKKANSLRAKK
ncbi:hypothetical protein SARC_03341 [Sphaeroforma arctica JP610]|uniref:Large ribosomal subunit protein mL54 n=1 Tax=Sphaeroforma arctica JP610 TaxID=667725 RepID=A0A0L0G6D9_9EUKA|nr:hypothetical protein SARC_03341 [Sphaeroforma arctica JP610]KNC84446.1 hypothetical protein SARC_03341 [Sphaeroforma arctica JP610]|eukprot:XP_014158348.1 hypothetical protein SARC_03341 [Sphaeroforma arctica JP610]